MEKEKNSFLKDVTKGAAFLGGTALIATPFRAKLTPYLLKDGQFFIKAVINSFTSLTTETAKINSIKRALATSVGIGAISGAAVHIVDHTVHEVEDVLSPKPAVGEHTKRHLDAQENTAGRER